MVEVLAMVVVHVFVDVLGDPKGYLTKSTSDVVVHGVGRGTWRSMYSNLARPKGMTGWAATPVGVAARQRSSCSLAMRGSGHDQGRRGPRQGASRVVG